MRSVSVSTSIQRQSTSARRFPSVSVRMVRRFMEPFLNTSQAVVRVNFSARMGRRVICTAVFATRKAL